MKSFPTNPVNNQLFETAPGVYYKYSTTSNSWSKVLFPTLPLATKERDGLMSKEDYIKLSGMLSPPPQITLQPQGCDPITSGLVEFQGDGIVKVDNEVDKVHPNTGMISLSLDVDKLIEKLKTLGRYRITPTPGDDGDQGDAGDDGLNSLPVGPYGPDGQPGANAPWEGVLVEDQLKLRDDNRAIVDITTERVSPQENYIVIKRANIGNPDACPDRIKPQDIQSPWLLAFTSRPSTSLKSRTQDGKLVCSWACNSSIYYFNVDVIVQSIRRQWISYLAAEKAKREEQLQNWTDSMKLVFDHQKAALTSALEACRSRYRNVDARRYIESQRIAAASMNYKVVIGSARNGRIPSFYRPDDYYALNLIDPTVELE
jgi:hypothetical protein